MISIDTYHQTAQLSVDTSDPYHFDHPLDHVPGMALVCGLLELLPVDARRAGRISLELQFPTFCELGSPVGLAVTASAAGGFDMRAFQDGQDVCTGLVQDCTDAICARPTGLPEARHLRHADGAPVHRRSPANIFISEPVVMGETHLAAVLRPTVEHPLAGRDLELLVDAARQYATLIDHTVHGSPADIQLVLRSVSLRLPGEVQQTAELAWTTTPVRTGRRTTTFDVLSGGMVAGQISFDYFAVTPAVYSRLRRAAGCR